MRSVHYLSFVLLPALALTCVQTLVIAADDAQEANTTSQGAHRPSRNAIPADTPADIRKQIELTFSNDRHQRGAAATALGEMGERAAVSIPFLIPLLNDWQVCRTERYETIAWDVHVRDIAFNALCNMGKAPVEPCLSTLEKRSPYRQACLKLLGQLKDERAIAPIVAHFHSTDRYARIGAIAATRDWSHPKFVEPLIEAVGDEESSIREYAISGLGSQTDPRAVAPLIAATNDTEASLRPFAVEALGKLDDARAVMFIRQMLDDTTANEDLRRHCAVALAAKSRPEDVDHLFDVINDAQVPDRIRGGIAFGFELSKNARFMGRLTAVALDRRNRWYLRRDVLRAIERLGGKDGLAPLFKIANSKTDEIRVRCFAALGIVRITDGKIDNVEFVSIIERGYTTPQPGSYYSRDRAMRKIARNGRTDIVRDAARAMLRLWGVSEQPASSDDYVEK